MTPTRVAVFGGGSWGTTFAQVMCDAGAEVTLWARRPELAAVIDRTKENPAYLPGTRLPEVLRATADPAVAAAGADVAVLAVPSQQLRTNLAGWVPILPRDALLLSLAKGVELGTCKRMSEVVREVTGAPDDRVAVVSGPNLAREVAERQPAGAVVACRDPRTAARLQEICHTSYFRAYTGADVVGSELGGATKNVIALAVGIAIGMGFGNNTRSMLITRGLAELVRLGTAMGADLRTFAGLAGIGDLVATCGSRLSRNRMLGERLGRGDDLAEIVASTRQVAEGVKSCQSIRDMARSQGVEMPITEAVVAVVHGDVPPREAVRQLMSRSAKPEWYA